MSFRKPQTLIRYAKVKRLIKLYRSEQDRLKRNTLIQFSNVLQKFIFKYNITHCTFIIDKIIYFQW